MLEVGCNVGLNLKAIGELHNDLFGIEPNEKARKIVLKIKFVKNIII